MYDEICVKIVCFQNELLHFEDWNFGQFLRVDKTCFLRPGHNYVGLLQIRSHILCCIHNIICTNVCIIFFIISLPILPCRQMRTLGRFEIFVAGQLHF